MTTNFFTTPSWLKKSNKYFLPYSLLLVLSGLHLLFALRTESYFSLDDFAVISFLKDHSPSDMLSFLVAGDIWGFRKALGYLVYWLIFKIFLVNPLPYILVNFFLHALNVFLVYWLVNRLSHKPLNSLFAAFIVNQIYLSYFSNIHEYLAALFILLSLSLFIKQKHKLSLISFIFALFSKEVAFVTPLLLLGLSLKNKTSPKTLLPHFFILLIYSAYQLPFYLNKFSTSSGHPYSLNLDIFSRLHIYVPLTFMVIIIALFMLRFRPLLIFTAASLLSLAPALLLSNRHETYYLYIPQIILAVSIGLALPSFRFHTFPVYLLIIFSFGGRSFFPPLARQIYPNWQKYSILQTLGYTTASLAHVPSLSLIDFSSIPLERDAKLLLGSQVIDVFLPASVSAAYTFNYNTNDHVLTAIRKTY